MEAALDAGAEDVVTQRRRLDRGASCAPGDFAAVKAALEKAGLKPELAEITMKPTTESAARRRRRGAHAQLLDALENLDDVQDVYTTAVID